MTDPLRAALEAMVDEVREATRILSDGYVITPEGAKRQAAAIDRIHLAVAAYAATLADAARPALDVEALERAIEAVRAEDDKMFGESDLWQYDERVFARQLAAEYARLTEKRP